MTVNPRLLRLGPLPLAGLLVLGWVTGLSPAWADDEGSARVAAAVRATYAARQFSEVSIAPDGRHVAWVETLTGADGAPDGHSEIWVADTSDRHRLQRITAGSAQKHSAEGDVAWSPDSTHVAFVSDAQKEGHAQVYLAAADGSGVRPLTSASNTSFAQPSWSPDGKRFGVLITQGANRPLGPLAPSSHDTGEIRDAWFEQRFALIDLAGGRLHPVSAEDLYVYEYAWAPDGSNVAITAARGNGDDNWYVAALYRLDLGGAPMQLLYKPSLQIAKPTYSPDGRQIAFIEGLMSDEGSVGGDVYVLPAAGGTPENLTPGSHWSASSLHWTATGGLVVPGISGGDAQVLRLDPLTQRTESLWRGPETVTTSDGEIDLALAADGRTSAVIRSAFAQPPEIWAGPIGEWHALSQRNAAVRPAWGRAVSLHWKSGGNEVQGWLIYPADFDPAKSYPLVVRVHGGPGAAVTSEWPGQGSTLALAGAGYFLLEPNPRGSFGQGESFSRANVKDFGHGDLKDILAGVDEALHTAPIDPRRLGISGWSYGGYMTMWAVTQTNRFAAAVAGAGIANWQSYYGQNRIDQWMVPFFGATVYDDPAVYAKSSPIQYIKNVKTPTLVLVGDSDAECPAPQSYEFWHALKTLGVETRLMVYEHEGHQFKNPANQQDRLRRTLEWFDAHLR